MLIIVFTGLIIIVNKKKVILVNLLNEKIRAIKYTIVRYKKMEALTPNSGEKERIRRNIKELNNILDDLLLQAGDN